MNLKNNVNSSSTLSVAWGQKYVKIFSHFCIYDSCLDRCIICLRLYTGKAGADSPALRSDEGHKPTTQPPVVCLLSRVLGTTNSARHGHHFTHHCRN